MIKIVKTQETFNALITFNENEVKILEYVRMSILNRIKYDKEYATNSVRNVLSQKTNFLDGFVIEKCWNNIQDRMCEFYDRLAMSCDYLKENVLPKLDIIIQEKKTSKQNLIEEKNKYETNLKKLKQNVESLKKDYCEEIKKVTDRKTSYLKAVYKQKSKLNEYVKDLTKHGNLMHDYHNNFLVNYNEYTTSCYYYSEKIFPNLIESYQRIQERLLEEFKSVLTDLYNHSNFSSLDYQNIFLAFKANVDSINPDQDYKNNFNLRTDGKETILFDNKIQLNEYDIQSPSVNNDLFSNKIALNEYSLISSTINFLNDRKLRFRTEISQNDITSYDYGVQIRTLERDARTLSNQLRLIQLNKAKNEIELVRSINENLFRQIENLKIDEKTSIITELQISNEKVMQTDLSKYGTYGRSSSLTQPQLLPQIPQIQPPPPPPPKQSYETASDVRAGIYKIEAANQNSLFNHKLDLKDQPWFHGILPRKEVDDLLKDEGDFLVRETENTSTQNNKDSTKRITPYVISIRSDGVRHFLIYQNVENGRYGLENLVYNSISELVQQQHLSNEPISKIGAYLKTPILRQEWEIRHADVLLGQKIGSGQFGIVYKGYYKNMEVAIKSCNSDMKIDDVKTFVREGRILQRYDHKNIVKFIGIAIDEKPIYILMEFINGGSCQSYLKRNNNMDRLPTIKKLKLCEDCAEGMEYLEKNYVIHRDLAARNCLIDESSFILKLSDFGLTKELEGDDEVYEIKQNKQIPVRWASIELLNRNLVSTKSDVWAFGITCWEIFAYAALPYGDRIDNKGVRKFINEGGRLQCPEDCPIEIYNSIMQPCWLEEPNSRPGFTQLLSNIRSISSEQFNV